MIAGERFAYSVRQKTHEKEYLAYTLAKERIDSNSIDINKLLDTQEKIFVNRFNKNTYGLNLTSLQDINELLSDFAPNGVFGENFTKDLDEFSQNDNGKMAYGTSGNYSIGDTGITLAQASELYNTKQAAFDNRAGIIEAAEKGINSIIELLANNNDYMLAAAVADAYYKNQNLPANIAKMIPNNIIIDKNKLEAGAQNALSTVEKLRIRIDELSSLSKSSVWGANSESGMKKQYASAVQGVKGCFNVLGGYFHEVASAWALLQAIQRGDKWIVENGPKSNQLCKITTDPTLLTGATNKNKNSDIGKKNDITVYLSQDKAIMDIGISVKLRQGQGFNASSGRNSRKLSVGNFIASEGNNKYEVVANKLEKYIPNATMSGFAMYAAIGTAQSYAEDWNNLKQALGIMVLVDSISGSGNENDFVSLIVVNNKIFSVSDILLRIINSTVKGRGNGFVVNWLSLSPKRLSSSQNGSIFDQAVNRNKDAYTALRNSKISISLNFGNLYNSNIL